MGNIAELLAGRREGEIAVPPWLRLAERIPVSSKAKRMPPLD
jgi:hypothetical protein